MRNPIEVAMSIARQLCKEALWSSDRCTWMGLNFQEGTRRDIQSSLVGTDFYGGTAGIACLLAEAYQITRDEIFRITARAAIRTACDSVESLNEREQVGLYDGLAGVMLAAVLVDGICDEDDAPQTALVILHALEHHLPNCDKSDIVSGYSGILLSFLWCWRKLNHNQYLELALRCGERLRELAVEDEDGALSWRSGQFGERLTGYAHGCSGIALALLELYIATSQTDFLKLSQLAIRYEDKFYSEIHRNWLDLRNIAGHNQCSVAWCHGAPGILISRLRAFETTGFKKYLEDAQIASETSFLAAQSYLRRPQSDASLCHGSAGLMLCLWEAGQFFNDRRLILKAEALGARILADRMMNGCWANAFSLLEDTPQLMLGYTGIGYSFLRLGKAGTLLPLHLASSVGSSSTLHSAS